MTWRPPKGFFVCVRENGKDIIYPTHCTNSDYTQDCEVSEDGRVITLKNTCRLELLKTKNEGDWMSHDLLDKKLSYDVDLSRVKKGQNFAFYSCQLTKGDQYKDAQSSDSRTELDFMEANRIAWHTTYHKKWDRGGGCIMGIGGGVRMFDSDTGKDCNDLYGPGQYIDTNKPFHVEHIHTREKVSIEISQDGKRIWKEVSGEYWRQLMPEFEGEKHTLIISLWEAGYGMSWLDGQLRTYDDSHLGRGMYAKISNIEISDVLTAKAIQDFTRPEVVEQGQCCCF